MLELPTIPFELQRGRPLRGGAVEKLRSVTFVCDGLTTLQTREFLITCTAWMEDYNNWFCETVGVPNAQGLHLLYDRDVTATGEMLLTNFDETKALGVRVRAMGFGFSLSLCLVDIETHLEKVVELATEHTVSALAINLEHASSLPPNALWLSSVERLLNCKVNVGIIGPYSEFSRQGLLSSPVVSASDLTWYPITPPGRRSAPSTPIRHCHSRLRVYVDGSTGHIYPCVGLIGKLEGSLGTIHESIHKTGLAEEPVLELLDHWERDGPSDAELGDPVDARLDADDGDLPPICRRHRRALV